MSGLPLNMIVMFLVDKFQLVELIVGTGVTGNNQDVAFQQQTQLQSTGLQGQKVYIEAIETYSSTALAVSPLTSGNPIASPADIANATLTLVEASDKEVKKDIPLANLNRTWATAGAFVPPYQPLFTFFDTWAISWTKCYVTLVATAPVRPFSYLFGVYYSYQKRQF
jgi:hypothetical protein